MRKIKQLLAAGLLVSGIVLVASPAIATGPTPHLKTDICHNGTVVPVSINATSSVQDVGHGLLDLDSDEEVQSFTPHNANGHAVDSILRVYWKAGNNESNTWVNPNQQCSAPGPQGPPGNPGQDGEDGEDGTNGEDGKDGEDGDDGLTPLGVCTGNPGGVYFVYDREAELPVGHFFTTPQTPCYGPPGASGEGTVGPAGPTGPAGTAGKDGVNGTNGVDGAVGLQGPAGSVTETVAAPSTLQLSTAPVELPRTGLGDTLLWLGMALVVGGGGLYLVVRKRSII